MHKMAPKKNWFVMDRQRMQFLRDRRCFRVILLLLLVALGIYSTTLMPGWTTRAKGWMEEQICGSAIERKIQSDYQALLVAQNQNMRRLLQEVAQLRVQLISARKAASEAASQVSVEMSDWALQSAGTDTSSPAVLPALLSKLVMRTGLKNEELAAASRVASEHRVLRLQSAAPTSFQVLPSTRGELPRPTAAKGIGSAALYSYFMLPTLLRLFCRYGSRNPQSWFPSFLGSWSLISGAFPSCSRPHRHPGACAASSRSSCVGPSALSRFISLLFWVQPDVSPGNCWPFQGRHGQVVIRLPARVHLRAVTVQHISKEASPSGSVISAPRDVAVFGLDADGEEETLLGMFMYNVAKEPIQTFPLKVRSTRGGKMPGSKAGLPARPQQEERERFLAGHRGPQHFWELVPAQEPGWQGQIH
ncbi:uncharacterized protein LOC135576463 isoform X2 [Columba livia]